MSTAMLSIVDQSLLDEIADQVDWNEISECQTLSEDFIRGFADQADWEVISYAQPLSEEYIREFSDELDWEFISGSQTLSLDFIRMNRHKLIMCENLKECIKTEHAKLIFIDNKYLPRKLNSLILSYL